MNFKFFSPVKIVFGAGASQNIFNHIPESVGKTALLITGKHTTRAEHVIQTFNRSGIAYKILVQSGEPSINEIIQGVEMVETTKSDFVVSIGGGSVIDTGKAIAALATNQDNIMQYLEIIGQGQPLTEKPLPMIAIPTTSGTGAEVTCNSVISAPEYKVKVSLRSDSMYPIVALIDPELCLSMPSHITASTGMDALTQLIESFTSKFANPITDALCREGIARIGRSFKKVYDEPDNLDARLDMSLAALLSGITLANAKLGAVHGIAGPMGGMVNTSHGIICARLLGPVIEANIKIAEQQLCDLTKYGEIARILTGNSDANKYDVVKYINELSQYMHIKEIFIQNSDFIKLDLSQINLLASKSELSSSMQANPVVLSINQIKEIILQL